MLAPPLGGLAYVFPPPPPALWGGIGLFGFPRLLLGKPLFRPMPPEHIIVVPLILKAPPEASACLILA